MKILILSGEESGNIYARAISEQVFKLNPSASIRGYKDWGFETADLAVFGFWEVFKRIFFFLKVKRTMQRAIDEWQPDVVCTIDYPGMNLKLAAYAKSKGIKTVHVVCPQVWAWKSGRIPKIEASLDKLICFFPFEPKLFTPGFAHFFGHPLAEMIKPSERTCNPGGKKFLALLPGSRIGEIKRILPVMLKAIAGLDFSEAVIPAANPKAREVIDRIVGGGSDKLRVINAGARELLARADLAVVASGTATLEAALVLCPTLLVYKVGPLLGFFARLVIKGVRHVGLANIIAEKSDLDCPMPELLQEDFTPENVRRIVKEWLSDDDKLKTVSEKLSATNRLLVSDGSAVRRIAEFLV